MNQNIQVAIYARVSSERQAEAKTIESQLTALRDYVRTAGFVLPSEREFIDDGYSGSTLVRPGLEQLRDMVAAGLLDKLFVHSPDRLSRKYAYQVLLVDEFTNCGVEVVFLNRALTQTPEDNLLLQVQGMISEFERAKIMERSRRGKRHAAQVGRVSVLSGAPFGYRYIPKSDGADQGTYQIILEEARVVRQVFAWVGAERLSIGEVCRRLKQAGEKTRSGKTQWDRSVIWGMLRNPAYKGTAAFGKTHTEPMSPRLRARRNGSLTPKRARSSSKVAEAEWTLIPVPALVDEALFAVVQEQLTENRVRARIGERGARYLLQGLVMCAECGYAFYGMLRNRSGPDGQQRHYGYYRCTGSDANRVGGERICSNKQVRTDLLDEAVWQQVRNILVEPQRIAEEYERRLASSLTEAGEKELTAVQAQVKKLQSGIERLIDSYTEGLIEQKELRPRLERLRERIAHLEGEERQLSEEVRVQNELRLITSRLEEFAAKVQAGIDEADWQTRRELIRTLVKRIEISVTEVKVVFKVEPAQNTSSSTADKSLQHCRRRSRAAFFGLK